MGTATDELQEEGYKLMGAAFEVYNEQGYGLAEEIYHCLITCASPACQWVILSTSAIKTPWNGNDSSLQIRSD